ncbi:hypothetical protein [Moorena sp. SIO4G3]|nr:hypothetical protein [Moorena sp. SIO4G3]
MIPCLHAGHPYSLFSILYSLFPISCSLIEGYSPSGNWQYSPWGN